MDISPKVNVIAWLNLKVALDDIAAQDFRDSHLVSLINGISNFVGYLMPIPSTENIRGII